MTRPRRIDSKPECHICCHPVQPAPTRPLPALPRCASCKNVTCSACLMEHAECVYCDAMGVLANG